MNVVDFKNINSNEILLLFRKVGISSESYEILFDKINQKIFYVDNISSKLANIVKQSMLSVGGDVAVNKDVAMYLDTIHPIVIFGTIKQIKLLIEKLKFQPFGAKILASNLENIVSKYNFFLDFNNHGSQNFQNQNIQKIETFEIEEKQKFEDNQKISHDFIEERFEKQFQKETEDKTENQKNLEFLENINYRYQNYQNYQKFPKIFGILNITEDSFFDGGKYNTFEKIEKRINFMLENGIKYIDIGAMSSRPGSNQNLSEKEEIDRLLMTINVIKKLDRKDEITISCDTFRANVADICLKNGAKIINDIYGTSFDENMPLVLKKHDAKIIIMHMKGSPQNMQDSVNYKDLIFDILDFFDKRIKFLVNFGIKEENIILDPGIGFGKNLGHNLEILRNINIFKIFKLPIMIGHSRKSFIGEILRKDVDYRLFGTISVSMYLFMKEIDYIRIHDIAEHIDLLKIFNSLKS